MNAGEGDLLLTVTPEECGPVIVEVPSGEDHRSSIVSNHCWGGTMVCTFLLETMEGPEAAGI